jgi:hypothetical protein
MRASPVRRWTAAMSDQRDTVVLRWNIAPFRWTVRANREDLKRNGIRKPPEAWEPMDLVHAYSLGLIGLEVELEEAATEEGTMSEHEPH